jgi:uncharacterized protein (TIGR03435 family)
MTGIFRVLSAGLAFAAICAAQKATFEVASVKPTQPGVTGRSFTQRPGGGLVTSNATIRMLMAFAYQVMPEEISGGPPWVESDGFDIDAKGAAPKLTQSQFREMIQSLLAERFQLKMHRETRELTVYVLVQAKNGAKLVEAIDDNPEASLRIQGPGQMSGVATLPALATTLMRPLRRKVIDETGLKGSYNFKIRFAPEQPSAPGADTVPPSDGPSIFTALQDQLGLRLKTAKRPIEVLVIDTVTKPAPN